MEKNTYKDEIYFDSLNRIEEYIKNANYLELYEYSNWLYSITKKVDFIYYQAYSLYKLGDYQTSYTLFNEYSTMGLTYLDKTYYYLYYISLLIGCENEYYREKMEDYYLLKEDNIFSHREIKLINEMF